MTDIAVDESPSGETNPAAETTEAPKNTPISLLVGTILRPAETFRQLRDAKHSYWWLVLLVTLVMVAALSLAEANAQAQSFANFTSEGGGPVIITDGPTNAEGASPSVQKGGSFESANGAPVTQVQSGPSVLVVILPLVGGAIITLLDYSLRALSVFLMSMLLGGKAAFKDTFRMAAWTTIPAAIRSLVQTIAVVLTGGQVAAGFSAALSTAETFSLPLLNLLLRYVDFYTIWSALLLGIGAAIVGKLSRGKAAFTVGIYIGVSLVGILIYFAITNAIGGALGGGGGGGPRGGFPGGGRARPGG